MTTFFATSGVDEDGTRWVSPGGPEHLTELRGRAVRAMAALPRRQVPSAKQVIEARVYLQIIIDGLELAAGDCVLGDEP
jgi:hypothetical protein